MMKMTQQRRVILEEITTKRNHPSAYEVYEMVRKRLPHVSLGTIYRNLEMMSESGVIRKLELSGAQRRYDGETSNHSHIRCVKCGRVDDLETEAALRLDGLADRSAGYEIVGHKVEILGICPACGGQAKNQAGLKPEPSSNKEGI